MNMDEKMSRLISISQAPETVSTLHVSLPMTIPSC